MTTTPVRRRDPGPGRKCRTKLCFYLLSGVFLISITLASGCASPSLRGRPGTSPAPQTPWKPPPGALAQPAAQAPRTPIPLDSLTARSDWTLADIVDIALRTSSETRAAWAAARSAAAAYGSKRGEWLPSVNVNASVGRSRSSGSEDRPADPQRNYAVSADASWLLFNFGGRRAAVEETRQALLAADWTHNAAIQNTVLRVERAYYDYLTARALLAAEEASRQDAQTVLDAAEERHRAGLATIADVLQARTALSQVELDLATVQGAVAITRGALATSMGLPADTGFDIEAPALDPPAPEVIAGVEAYLEAAKARRPDLAAARAQARQSEAHVRRVVTDRLPSISATGSLGRVYRDSPERFSDPYAATLQLRWPLFDGFSSEYEIARSRADAEEARARLVGFEQSVVLQVWTSYYGLKTAEQRLLMTADLLAGAMQSHEVAQGRYSAGVGTILDLLSAQATLVRARAQRAQAVSDWYISLAQLARDTGELDASGPGASSEGKQP